MKVAMFLQYKTYDFGINSDENQNDIDDHVKTQLAYPIKRKRIHVMGKPLSPSRRCSKIQKMELYGSHSLLPSSSRPTNLVTYKVSAMIREWGDRGDMINCYYASFSLLGQTIQTLWVPCLIQELVSMSKQVQMETSPVQLLQLAEASSV